VHVLVEKTAFALNADRQVNYEVARHMEPIHTQDVTHSIEYSLWEMHVCHRVQVSKLCISGAWPFFKFTFHVHAHKLITEFTAQISLQTFI